MHLKREASPKNWPIERKGTTYLVKPSHDFDRGVPILIIVRDMLELAKDRKEVKKALTSGQIFLNHKRVVDEKNNALLLDVLTLVPPKSSNSDKKQYYRIEMGENKKFRLQEISENESETKCSKVIKKMKLKGNKTQINLSDGRNFLSDVKCKTNDSLLINLKTKKIVKCIELQKNTNVIVFAGKHTGAKGIIQDIDEENKIVKIQKKNHEIIGALIKQVIAVEIKMAKEKTEKAISEKEKNNPMRTIRIEKIVLSVGGVEDGLHKGFRLLEILTGKKPMKTKSRKRIPSLGVRPDLEVGALVTIRKDFDQTLRKLLVAVENTVKRKQVSENTFSFGIKEYIEIPGQEYQREIGIIGLDVTVTFTRAGKRVKLKKIRSGKLPKKQMISKEDIIKFMEDNFQTKFVGK